MHRSLDYYAREELLPNHGGAEVSDTPNLTTDGSVSTGHDGQRKDENQ